MPAIARSKQDQSLPSSPLNLEKYLDRLLEEKEIAQVDEEVKKQLKTDLQQRLNSYLNAKLIAQLSDEQVQKLQALLANNPPANEVTDYFEANIPNFTVIIASILLDFRKKYLGII